MKQFNPFPWSVESWVHAVIFTAHVPAYTSFFSSVKTDPFFPTYTCQCPNSFSHGNFGNYYLILVGGEIRIVYVPPCYSDIVLSFVKIFKLNIWQGVGEGGAGLGNKTDHG